MPSIEICLASSLTLSGHSEAAFGPKASSC